MNSKGSLLKSLGIIAAGLAISQGMMSAPPERRRAQRHGMFGSDKWLSAPSTPSEIPMHKFVIGGKEIMAPNKKAAQKIFNRKPAVQKKPRANVLVVLDVDFETGMG